MWSAICKWSSKEQLTQMLCVGPQLTHMHRCPRRISFAKQKPKRELLRTSAAEHSTKQGALVSTWSGAMARSHSPEAALYPVSLSPSTVCCYSVPDGAVSKLPIHSNDSYYNKVKMPDFSTLRTTKDDK